MTLDYFLDFIVNPILVNLAFGFCFSLGVAIMSQGIMEYLDWQRYDIRPNEKLLEYSSKIGLGLAIVMVFLKLYLTK